jgi:cell wall-associated NlpC family hydrolase
MKRNFLGVIFVGLAAVGILTIANAQNNIDNASAAETVDFDSIISQSDINDDNNDITDIDTQELGLLGADVFSLDEIETATEEAVEIYTENDDDNEYADLAIANVTNYVNVRSNPNTDSEIVGKIYNGAVAQVLSTAGDNNDWFQIVSGNVEGYIKAEFFIYGEDAAEVIDNYVTRYAVVIADRLNVREEPSTDAKRIGYIDNGEKVKIVENQGEWLKVEYTTDKIGYIATEYVNITEEFVYAKTIAEEQAELAAIKALEEREKVSEETASENVTITVTPPSTNYSSNSELRNSIVEYSMQFLGNKYVHGGQSLVTGTDCSGFTSLIYKEFGYSVSRTPAGQLSSNGRSISYSEIQPGDIICYGSSGKCTHVALYIGNGQIIHSANSRKGVVIYNADYDTILGVKNIID